MRPWPTPQTLLVVAVSLCIAAALAATGGEVPPATQNTADSAGDNAASPDAQQPTAEAQIYDVTDLVAAPGYLASETAVSPVDAPLESPPQRQNVPGAAPPQAPPTRVEALVALIREQIDPDSWWPNGQVGRIQANGSRLTIVCTPADHKLIARLLEDLRRAYPGPPLNIDARWLLADDKQLASLRPGSPAPGEIDPAAARDLTVLYRAGVSCFNDHPATVHSGPARAYSVYVTPVVSETAVAHQVEVEEIQGGVVLQLRPVLLPNGRDVILDLHADLGLPREGGTIPLVDASKLKSTTAPAVAVEQVDRLDFDVVSFKTTTRLPLGKPMLVSTAPAPQGKGNWLCLVVKVTRKAQPPQPAAPASAPAPLGIKHNDDSPMLYTRVYGLADLRVPRDYPFPQFKPTPFSEMATGGGGGGGGGIFAAPDAPGNNPPPPDPFQTLLLTIQNTDPDSWKPNGQVGALSTLGSRAAITQTEATHVAIGQLLERMRRSQPSRIVGIESKWLLLDTKQLRELHVDPGGIAPTVVNLGALPDQPQPLAAQSLPCTDGQTVYMIAGRMQTYLYGAIPVVSEAAVAHAPLIGKYYSGGVMEIQPMLDSESDEVTVTVQAQFHGPQDKWEKIPLVDARSMKSQLAAAIPVETLDRLSASSASIRTQARLRLGKQTVVGVVNSPELGQDKVMALILRVTEQK